MPANRFYIFTLILLSFLFGYLTYLIFKPFISAIMWAGVLAIIFYPVYVFIRRYVKWKSLASLLTIVIIVTIIIGPFSYLVYALGKELRAVTSYLEVGELTPLNDIVRNPTVSWMLDKIQGALGIHNVDIGKLLVKNITIIGKDLIGRLSDSARNIVLALINFIFMVFASYFLIKDGPDFMGKIRNYLPFSDTQKDRLVQQVKDMVISTIYGGVIVALSQGVLGGVTFFALGIPSPVIWGTAIAIMSFIPMLGTFSIWGPACVYLFVQGAVVKGFVLLVVGTFGISMIDNILKPLIISGRTKMPTVIIFFSVLGGIKLFGLIGLIMGPLVVALFISVFEIFRNIENADSLQADGPDGEE
ncbi:putative inner membrane protein [bacterium BMS3Bbin05]|nr:putative inner membrane protein [bacterium BMS3Bbin05]HDL20008.1 AI-2E family transporter [Nitrospirota bacterium]HDO21609.1 AI-2E family transporter [Nitrospirota bacterium]HDZ88654.1 AI-2E family transporter [Nitrospirota bacterium]